MNAQEVYVRTTDAHLREKYPIVEKFDDVTKGAFFNVEGSLGTGDELHKDLA